MRLHREEPRTSSEFAKDPEQEQFLDHLNRVLERHEAELCPKGESDQPICFVTGVPRSGTTLAHQVLCASLDVGYVNNLIAAFWRAPLHGIRLSNKLLADGRPSSFDSVFGRTEDLTGPHEFGYFWSEMLGYDRPIVGLRESDEIDWGKLAGVLRAMAREFDRPTVLKSFHLGWHAADTITHVPRSAFIWMRREAAETAASLLEMRRRFIGSEAEWASFRPSGFEHLDGAEPVEQVAAQAILIERAIEQSLQATESDRIMIVDYNELCDSPELFLHSAAALMERLGVRPRVVRPPPGRFQPSHYRERDPELFDRIVRAVERMREA